MGLPGIFFKRHAPFDPIFITFPVKSGGIGNNFLEKVRLFLPFQKYLSKNSANPEADSTILPAVSYFGTREEKIQRGFNKREVRVRISIRRRG